VTLLLLLGSHGPSGDGLIRSDDVISPDDVIYPDGREPAKLSIPMRTALLAALIPAYHEARATLDDLSPTTLAANAMFAAAFVVIVGIAIVQR
jgi:hypothetical protein